MKTIRIAELFSGIGATRTAIDRVAKKRGIVADSVLTSEWEISAIVAYYLLHCNNKFKEAEEECNPTNLTLTGKTTTDMKYFTQQAKSNICKAIKATNNCLDIRQLESLPKKLNILTYSFPCQDLSVAGGFHGKSDGIKRGSNTRSALLWEVERLLRQSCKSNLPQILLLENVVNLDASKHKSNFQEFQEFLNKLGYINRIYKLNANKFGIPQYRKRLFMISVLTKNKKTVDAIKTYFDNNNLELKDMKLKNLKYFLYLNDKRYNDEAMACCPNNTPSRKKIWEDSLRIYNGCVLRPCVQTITTKQDRHPNSGVISFEHNIDGKSNFRYLTPRECFLLMGFKNKDFDILQKNNFMLTKKYSIFHRNKLYKLAGNSIVIPMLEAVIDQVFDLMDILKLSHNN